MVSASHGWGGKLEEGKLRVSGVWGEPTKDLVCRAKYLKLSIQALESDWRIMRNVRYTHSLKHNLCFQDFTIH